MSIRQKFYLFYYSQISLVLLAIIITSSISAILYSTINWNVILLIGFSTYLTYSIDNLIDWKADQHHYVKISKYVGLYHKLTYFILPFVALLIVLLVLQSSNELKIGILLLGAFVLLGITRFSKNRDYATGPKQLVRSFLINRLFISLVWTIVCIFIPIWYDGYSITKLTLHTFVYSFFPIFTYAFLWKFEKANKRLKKHLVYSKMFSCVLILPIIPMIIVILDVLIGFRPPSNLVNILPPAVMLITMRYIYQNQFCLRHKIIFLNLILSFTIFCTLITNVVF
jgi:hypothetical protein